MMHIQILGTRGIPSRHGGFETFAHDLALFLTERGHRVTVYCQMAPDEKRGEDIWNGVRRILIPADWGALGTVIFDWKSSLHALREEGLALTLGYNTAIFSLLFRLARHGNIMNMDGIEWKRQKWSKAARLWLRMNEWFGAKLADHLIADHPMIAAHLKAHTRPSKISMIPYGSEGVETPDESVLERYGLASKSFYLVIARPEPDNSILEIVSAYSNHPRRMPLVVLGNYMPGDTYHASVLREGGPGVRFLGPVYDRGAVAALRLHATAYVHGHQVGGTNPSLVESLAAGNPIIAHDNIFTRWVIGDPGMYFADQGALDKIFAALDEDQSSLPARGQASKIRYEEKFSQMSVLLQYESLLNRFSREPELHSEGRPRAGQSI